MKSSDGSVRRDAKGFPCLMQLFRDAACRGPTIFNVRLPRSPSASIQQMKKDQEKQPMWDVLWTRLVSPPHFIILTITSCMSHLTPAKEKMLVTVV